MAAHRPHPFRRAATGFTLLEVLVALAIAAVALSALTYAAAGASRNAAHMRDRTLAHWVAMNQVAALQLGLAAPRDGAASGLETLAGRDWDWRAEITETEDPQVRRVTLEVRGSPGAQPATRLHAFLYVGEEPAP